MKIRYAFGTVGYNVDVCGGFTSVYPAQVLRTSISSSCWVFARYIFHVLVLLVYHQYLCQVYTLESDRWVLDRPGRIFSVLVANQYMCILSVSIAPFLVYTVGILMAWASLLCWSVCVVSSVEGLMSAVCVWTQVVLSPTASLFAFHWSIRWAFLLLVEGEKCFFFWGLAGSFSCFFNGFSSLDPHQLHRYSVGINLQVPS